MPAGRALRRAATAIAIAKGQRTTVLDAVGRLGRSGQIEQRPDATGSRDLHLKATTDAPATSARPAAQRP